MKVMFPSRAVILFAGSVFLGQASIAQSSIQLFKSVYTRQSPAGLDFTVPPYIFSNTTVSISCPAEGIPYARLSGPLMLDDGSAPNLNNGKLQPGGSLLVDNNVLVTITPAGGSAGQTQNVCPVGEIKGSPGISVPPDLTNACFVPAYASNLAQIAGKDPDTFAIPPYGEGTAQTVDFFGGVPPIDISAMLSGAAGLTVNLTVQLADEGAYLASSSIFLESNCTINGVTGPSTSGGNPISGTNNSGTTQEFDFNPNDGKLVGFVYDVSGSINDLSKNKDGSVPQVGDSPLDPATWQPSWAIHTPFATSSCFVHFGELLPNGITSACKLYTLDCIDPTTGKGTGANCPVSSQANEKINDHFDGPTFSLPNIYNSKGNLITHEGVGFLMASETWAPPGGPCTFESASGLSANPCPQNLLNDFSGPGAFSGTGITTNPNSTFISIYGVPEPYTAVSLQGAKDENWVNTNQPQLGFTATPPNFTNGARIPVNGVLTPLPGAANFIPAPIASLTYGISPAASVPVPKDELTLNTTGGDITLMNTTCPSTFSSLTEPSFKPPRQTIFGLPGVSGPIPDGHYMVHYYARDCSGTQELKFGTTGQFVNGEPVWATNFYTIPVNIDTTKPVVTIQPLASSYVKLNSTVYAQFYCTDASTGSGVTHCGSNSFDTESTYNTGILQMKINTSSLGQKTLIITGSDGAGNSSSASKTYTVVK